MLANATLFSGGWIGNAYARPAGGIGDPFVRLMALAANRRRCEVVPRVAIPAVKRAVRLVENEPGDGVIESPGREAAGVAGLAGIVA